MKAQLLAACAAIFLTACSGKGSNGDTPAPQYAAEVTRTSYGVAHIQAKDFAGVGYGLAYSFAEDNICMLADSFLTVRGERSRYFGPDARATKPLNGEYGAALDFMDLRNEDSDFFFKGYLHVEKLRADMPPAPARSGSCCAAMPPATTATCASMAGACPRPAGTRPGSSRSASTM